MSEYATVAELKAFRLPGSTGSLDFTSWTDPQLQYVLDDAEAEINLALNQRFVPFGATVFGNGNDSTHLFMPQDAHFPHKIISITSVAEVQFDQQVVIQTFVEGQDFQFEAHYLRANDTVPARIRNAVGRLWRWPRGVRNIRIIGTFGWAEVPRPIKKAILWYSVIQTLGESGAFLSGSSGDTGTTREEWEDYTVLYGAPDVSIRRKGIGVPTITGYLDIDRLLAPFVNYSTLFNVPPLTVDEAGHGSIYTGVDGAYQSHPFYGGY